MKTNLLLLVCLSVLVFSCATEDDMISPWGIDFSTENSSGFATGTLEQYIGQAKTTYTIKTANLRCAGGDVFALTYTFESGDVMEVKLA